MNNNDKEFLEDLNRSMARTKTALDGHGKTGTAQHVANSKRNTLSILKEIGKSGSLEAIITAEKSIVAYDLKEYANSEAMVSSLKAATKNMTTIENNIRLLKHPEGYKNIEISFQESKMLDSRGLPLDGARLAFGSHITRLGNYDKSGGAKHPAKHPCDTPLL